MVTSKDAAHCLALCALLAIRGASVAGLIFFASCSLSYPLNQVPGQLGIIVLLENLPRCMLKCVCLCMPVHGSVCGTWFSARQVIRLPRCGHQVGASVWQMNRYL